jgi:hypothetical protein
MEPTRSHVPSLLSSLLFILGAALGLSVAVLMGVVALSRFLTGGNVDARETIILAIAGFEGLLLLGAAFVSIQKFLQRPSAETDSSFTISVRQVAACIFVAGIALLIGHQIVINQTINWLLLPILTLVAVILPILILLGLGIRKIPLGTRWQSWNVFGLAMTIVPFILFFLEIFAMVLILLLAVGIIASQPSLVFEMERLSQQIYLLGPDPEEMLELLAPIVTRPGVIATALIYFAVLVPLMEEFIKPLGVWFFANQLSSPAQGFALGALSGSAYALIETLGVSIQTADWAALLLSRIGTGILHVTASALMGGAIAFAVRERRYLRLLGTYLVSVSLHGLWNALAIFYTFSTLAETIEQRGFLHEIRVPVVSGMAILAITMLAMLILSNRRMRKTIPLEAAEPLVI